MGVDSRVSKREIGPPMQRDTQVVELLVSYSLSLVIIALASQFYVYFNQGKTLVTNLRVDLSLKL